MFTLGTNSASAQTITGVPIPPPAHEFLLDLMRDAGISSVRVSSFERSPRRQAELMYDLLESVAIADVHEQYDSIGDLVVDFYELNRERMSEEELIQGMEQVVSEGVLAAPNRQQMMHVLPTNNYTFDVAPSSVTPNEDAFVETIRKHAGFDLASHILPGPAERAYHLEVSKTLRTVSGPYAGVCGSPVRGTMTPIAITLKRDVNGYSGRYSVYGESFPITVATVDRTTKEVALEASVADDAFAMAGALRADYSALNLRSEDDASLNCRLDRDGE